MPRKSIAKQKKQAVPSETKSKATTTRITEKKKIEKPTAKKTVAASKAKAPVPSKKASAQKLSHREKKFQDIKKNLLAQKKSLLMGAMEALNELPGPTVFPDLGDQATAEMDRNFMLRLRGRERKLLKKIDEAIERIDQHIFGICDRCGDAIDIRRLEARPVTTMCIECKTLEEEEEKLREP